MDLQQYLDEYSGKQQGLAEKAGLTPSVLSKLLNGADVKFSTAMKICIASKGKITAVDLYKNLLLHKNANDSTKKHKRKKHGNAAKKPKVMVVDKGSK